MIAGTFRSPFIAYGEGVSQKLGEYCTGLGKNALIVTDAVLEKAGILNGLKESLRAAKLEFNIFDQVITEPVVKYAEEGLRIFKENRCDLLISVGGGSCIDTAKGISILATNPGRLPDFEGMNRVQNPGIPHVAIPTTAGTGSEVSPSTIITDPDRNVKMLLMSPHLGSRLALVDPLLTVQMPQHVTASSGLDALTHAIEGYISIKAHPVTDALTLHAIQLISQNLPQAWLDGNNIAARTNMMIGALEAGMGFCNSSVALVHGMARPLGAYFHIPHGLANAVLLPIVMEFTVVGNPPKFADIARAMGENTERLSIMEAAFLSVKVVKRLKEVLKIPSISGLGISAENFNRVVEQMSKDALVGGSAGFNPRKATPEEIINLYRKAF
jgi:alcohol dehydrogenase class IV